jgi:hypothetical protein
VCHESAGPPTRRVVCEASERSTSIVRRGAPRPAPCREPSLRQRSR